MPPPTRLALGVLLASAFAAGAGADDALGKAAPGAKLSPGLTDEQVRQRLGAPGRTSRQVLLHRSLEQWHYGAPLRLRLTFECARGRRPQLVGIHTGAGRDR